MIDGKRLAIQHLQLARILKCQEKLKYDESNTSTMLKHLKKHAPLAATYSKQSETIADKPEKCSNMSATTIVFEKINRQPKTTILEERNTYIIIAIRKRNSNIYGRCFTEEN